VLGRGEAGLGLLLGLNPGFRPGSVKLETAASEEGARRIFNEARDSKQQSDEQRIE